MDLTQSGPDGRTVRLLYASQFFWGHKNARAIFFVHDTLSECAIQMCEVSLKYL